MLGPLFVAVEEHGVLPMFYLELTTGLRRGELTALLWTDLDVEKRTLTVSRSAGRLKGEVRVTQPKTANSVRTICLPKETIDLLVREHAKHPSSPVMFPSPVTGQMYCPDSMGRLHKTLLKKAGITENIPFHGLRHTCVTATVYFAQFTNENPSIIIYIAQLAGIYSIKSVLTTPLWLGHDIRVLNHGTFSLRFCGIYTLMESLS